MAYSQSWRDALFAQVFSRMDVFKILFEDTDIERQYFDLQSDSRVLVISGAGCGVASMLVHRPASIDAVDMNPHHLALTGLKVAATRQLTCSDTLYALFGHGHHPDASRLIGELTQELPTWMQTYWRKNANKFLHDFYRQGFFYRIIGTLHRQMQLDADWLRALAGLPVTERQQMAGERYRRVLSKIWIRAVVDSPLPLLAQGINFRQRDLNLHSNAARSMGEVLLNLVDQLARTDVGRNWIIWHCQLAKFDHQEATCRPPFLRPALHQQAQGAPTQTNFHRENLFHVLGRAAAGSWTHYGLSDAMDWMPPTVQQQVLSEICRTAAPGARVIIRTVAADDLVAKLGMQNRLQRLDAISARATAEECSRLYRRTDLYQVMA
jgi:S-adenosylmethionine-diacylglycerol 3-amino-3-carboxypropyl transferase